MVISRLTVFLPCHTLDDFPTWLEEVEADDLLAAWTAAWEPCLLATVGDVPAWASIDMPPHDDAGTLGIVPAMFADRFSHQSAGGVQDGHFIERTSGRAAITAAAMRAVGVEATDGVPGAEWSEDFRALGLAVLLSEVLARRMRTAPELGETAFGVSAVAAARAAVAGDGGAVRERLRECWGFLECCRARYYPADLWLVDLVLVARNSAPAALEAAVEAPVPIGLVFEADALGPLAAKTPAAVERIRTRLADGTLSLLGGRQDAKPLDLCTPEEVVASFSAGLGAWEALGFTPAVFARFSGGATPLLPPVLSGFGFTGMVWSLFDGTPLPDPHAGRIRWEGAGGTIEAVARPPLDARRAVSVTGLPSRLGDALDHDHVAVLTFAHFAGTSGEWHHLIRRIGSWSTVLGTFVTPDELFRRTADGGSYVRLDADAFPVTLPETASPGGDAVGAAVGDAAVAAGAVRRESAGVASLLSSPRAPDRTPARVELAEPPRAWPPWRRRGARHPSIDNGLLRVTLHSDTGGILSLRRPGDRANRLSQQLATRRVDGDGEPVYTRMHADRIEKGMTACGEPGLVAAGRLVDGGGGEVGRFTQGVALVPGAPLAVIDIELTISRPFAGDALECYAASRFAWSENDDLEVRRSLHTQSVKTEREVFTAPHFIELRPAGPRAGDGEAVTILTGGVPWHTLASPHILDAVLFTGGGARAASPGRFTRRLGIGVGLRGVGEAALALAAGSVADLHVVPRHPTVRVTLEAVSTAEGMPPRVRVGLLESAGRSGDVRLEWAAEPREAVACDLRGRPRGSEDTASAHVAIDGRATVVFLRAFEWLHMEVEFRDVEFKEVAVAS
ncbi:MAG TPA: hypothetical protein DC048_13425 [Planctomycetaceae bacterium]|nr:hypothetical protein [Planctomycetaceae bacterium]